MPTCCGPCSGQNVCADSRNCCLECHFAYEEANVLPYLPPGLQARLIEEHRWLTANGYPEPQISMHAAWEDATFGVYLPPEMYQLLVRDHAAHKRGQLTSRAGR